MTSATMRAAVIDEWGGALRLETRAIPAPGRDEVLVRVAACGLGLTIDTARSGAMGGSLPRVLGHELGGEVVGAGAGVVGWSAGDRVTGSFYLLCGSCAMCTGGRETLCRDLRGFVGTTIDGALAEHVVVPAANLVAVPDGVGLDEAAIAADAIATPYHVATKRAPLAPGARVAVVGAGGGVGAQMVEVARAFGATVVAVESDATKLARLTELEPHAIVDSSQPGWADELQRAAGGELSAYIDFAATQETLEAGPRAVGRGGTVVVVGFRPGTSFALTPDRLIVDEIVVTGSRYATRAEIKASLELIAAGRIRPVIGARFPLERANEAMDAITRNRVFGRALVTVACEQEPTR
jgi:D-arabinose 1-dehydrogenase-like Zn-dependent alcohol dehydrogenase